MQKKIIALAVATAFSAPAFAEVTVYGQAHVSLDSNSGNAGATATAGTQNGLNLTSNSSRVGFKGSEDLGGGLKGVFQLETEVAATGATSMFATQRDSYIGVGGGFGTVLAGRLPLANQYANDANFFASKVGDLGTFTAGGFGGAAMLAVPSRISRAIAYASPSLGGVNVLVAYVPNTPQSLVGTQNNLEKASSYTLRASYDNNGIFGALSLVNIGATGVSTNSTVAVGNPGTGTFLPSGAKIGVTSLAGGYDFGVGKVRGQYVATTLSAGGSDTKQNVFAVGGQFNLGEDDAIKVQIAKAANLSGGGTTSDTNGSSLTVGFDHKLSKSTTAYAAFSKVTNAANSTFSATGYAHGGVGAPAAGSDPSALSLGLIRDF